MSPTSKRTAMCGEIIPFSLRHDLLSFDSIGIFDLERKVQMLRERRRQDANPDASASLANDFEFLQSQGIVFSQPSPIVIEKRVHCLNSSRPYRTGSARRLIYKRNV
jgi:hypothetical protein